LSRVLLVCPEPLGHGQPAGVGIRFFEMARVLVADGHRVTILSPDGGSIDGCKSAVTSPQMLHVLSGDSDVIVVQGHVANDVFAHAKPVPTVVDLYDPYIIENFHYYSTRGAEVFAHDHATLLRSLARGDLFLCASEAQRLFWLGMLLAVGRLNPVTFGSDPHLDSLLRIAPFGVQPPLASAPRAQPAVLFGAVYDWYDPILAIDAVALAREQVPEMTLTFTRHPNPDITPQGKTAEAMEYVRTRGYDFVRFEPWAPYDQRAALFEKFALGLLTFPQSLETDLSMRTRVYDYLWCGLPIVTSSAPGTDEVLARYSAGAVVRGNDPAAYASALVSVAGDASAYFAGTRQFVREHQWEQTLEPLRDFCRAPYADPHKTKFAVGLEVGQHRASLLARLERRARRLIKHSS
jgi:glycosyltransferase involved in cell wall biosynthesis